MSKTRQQRTKKTWKCTTSIEIKIQPINMGHDKKQKIAKNGRSLKVYIYRIRGPKESNCRTAQL